MGIEDNAESEEVVFIGRVDHVLRGIQTLNLLSSDGSTGPMTSGAPSGTETSIHVSLSGLYPEWFSADALIQSDRHRAPQQNEL